MIYLHRQENQFEPLTRFHDRKSTWFANRHSRRRRARDHKRRELFEHQLADLDADLSTRFDNVIRTNDHNSNVQLPDLDFSPMQVVKWRPSALPSVPSPISHLQPTSDTDWSKLEINFLPPPRKALCPSLPSPPVSLMTAAELGLLPSLTPKVCLPELVHNSGATALAPSDVTIVAPWIPDPSVPAHISQNLGLSMDLPEDDDIASSFVAAKLPCFHGIDPFDLAAPSSPHPEINKDEHLKSQTPSTRCTLYHKDDYDLEEHSLECSQSLRSCEEGRTVGLVHAVSATTQAYALGADWLKEPVVDWPYDVLGDWNNEPALDWNGESVADWNNELVDDEHSDDIVMIEHDAGTYDWIFLSGGGALSDCISTLSSAFSSIEVLPLPLRDSFMDEASAYEEPVRELAENEPSMRRVSKSAWDSESDFLIPAFF